MAEDDENFECQQTQLLRVMENMINEFSTTIQNQLQGVFSCHQAAETPASAKILQDMNLIVGHNIQSLTKFYKFIKEGSISLVNDNNNLKEVNKKLIQRLQSQQQMSKSVSVNSMSTQTEVQHKEILDAASQTNPLSSCPENLDVSDSFVSSSYPNQSVEQKMQKIMIYNLDVNLDVPDIMQGICDTIGDSIPDIHFIKKFPRRQPNKFNYLIKVPQKIAIFLTDQKVLKIHDSMFPVRKFVRIIRCFNCQKFGHVANKCTHSRICAVCGESHDSKKCSKPAVCHNCFTNNKNYGHTFNINHPAFSKACSSLKFFILQVRLRSNQKSDVTSSTFNESYCT